MFADGAADVECGDVAGPDQQHDVQQKERAISHGSQSNHAGERHPYIREHHE